LLFRDSLIFGVLAFADSLFAGIVIGCEVTAFRCVSLVGTFTGSVTAPEPWTDERDDEANRVDCNGSGEGLGFGNDFVLSLSLEEDIGDDVREERREGGLGGESVGYVGRIHALGSNMISFRQKLQVSLRQG
jgi:hypothetical protein